jgi:predicted RNase H-like HicB family nuclease
MKDYNINIFYSEEDGGYIADIPNLEVCSAFGETPEEALRQVEIAKETWLLRQPMLKVNRSRSPGIGQLYTRWHPRDCLLRTSRWWRPPSPPTKSFIGGKSRSLTDRPVLSILW